MIISDMRQNDPMTNAMITEQDSAYAHAVLVALCCDGDDAHDVEVSFAELERLLETAGGTVVAKMIQNRPSPDPRTCIGAGKTEELKALCDANDVSLVVFDRELTPSQIRNLEASLGDDARVIDRSMLILDIFALHANSNEGKMQVELAQLKYTAPRLTGQGEALSRLGGGIGTRGPGETKLETDRRHLQRRIKTLEQQIDEMEENRAVQRKQRKRAGIFSVAIAGYTNAGKSTLLNALTGAGILAQDKLFATLDPTTRKYTLPHGTEILLTDTVGFIRNLPHHLIRAFHSTLQEVTYADLIVVLIDASDPEWRGQLTITDTLIAQLGAGEKPVLYVMNKCDIAPSADIPARYDAHDVICISAAQGTGLQELAEKLEEFADGQKKTLTFRFPYDQQGNVEKLHRDAVIISEEYQEDGVYVTAKCDARLCGQLASFCVND